MYDYDDVLMEKAAEWEMFKEAQNVRKMKLAPGVKLRRGKMYHKSLNAAVRRAGVRVTPEMARGARMGVEGLRRVNRMAGGNLYFAANSDPSKIEFGFRGRTPMNKARAEKLLKQMNISPADLGNNPQSVMRKLQGTPLAGKDPKEIIDFVFPKQKPAVRPAPAPASAPAPSRAARAANATGGGGSSKSFFRNPKNYAIGAGLLGAGYVAKKLYDRER